MPAEHGWVSYRSGPSPTTQPDRSVDLLGLALLAGIEAVTRLGRLMPVTVRGGAGVGYQLVSWPADVRRTPARHAAPAMLASSVRLAAGRAAAQPDGLEIWIGRGDPDQVDQLCRAVSRSAAVRVALTTDDGAVTAAAWCAQADPWQPALAAVAELHAEVFNQLRSRPELAPAQAEAVSPTTRASVLGPLAGTAYPPPAAPPSPQLQHIDPIPRQIERMAAAVPDRIAITHAGQSLTYRQVDGLANALAAEVLRHAARRTAPVPILGGSGLSFAVSALALMKLGIPYVPLDQAWPARRLSAALEVLRPDLVLLLEDALPPPGTTPSCRVRLGHLAPQPRPPERVELGPEDPLYGMFTSGSTGAPKCAINRHGGLANRLDFMSRYFAATGSEVVLQTTRHTADSSFWQLFWPLTTGGRSVIPELGDALDLEQVVATIRDHQVSVTDLVPRALRALVMLAERDASTKSALASLRHLVVGGEEIDAWAAHRLRELLPSVRLTNGYGPTEAAIGMIFHPVSPADGAAIPLGRPIDNCYALILDPDLGLLPPGAPGEIVIGGACLGTGYYGDPQRTAVAFPANPYPQVPARRLYRTGDLGYLDADGNLRFLGRRDDQVNIGGVRIELGEVETAALHCPGVVAAKAVTGDRAGQPVVALFVATGVGADGQAVLSSAVSSAAVRAHLAALLPRTQIPAYCAVLPRLPVTDSGKLDLTALRRLLADIQAAPEHAGGAGPATAVATAALSVLRSLPGLATLGPAEDMMAAGVDSLRALDAVWQLRAAYQVTVGVQDLFDHPSAEALDRVLAARRGTGGSQLDELALMDSDATLPHEIEISPAGLAGPVGTVLVTGATGFVGGRTVAELLADGRTAVICLCRARDDRAARERVVSWLHRQRLWHDHYTSRLAAYAADLSRERLGLPEATWNRLAVQADLILHVGALVNFVYDYADHRRANVLGTREVLRLAMHGRAKPVHHVSTLGVLAHEAMRGGVRLDEQVDPAAVPPPPGGYSRSKWVAERLLIQARDKGATVTIFRLGEVMPAADNGFPNPRALTHLLCRAFHRLGVAPQVPMRTDYTLVDRVAETLTEAVRDPSAWRETYHVFDPHVVCLGDVPGLAGRPIRRVAADEFVAALRAAAAGDARLAMLSALLHQRSSRPPEMFDGLLDENPALFAQERYRHAAARWRLAAPAVGTAINAYGQFLVAEPADGPGD